MIPVTILTGFLGAGKTTLLNHLLMGDHGLRVAVMVNDFGAVNIDAQLVVGEEGEDTVNLANGCICCTIRDDLRQAVWGLIERAEPPEYIVIEASGVSVPAGVAHTFTETKLQQQTRIDGILTVVDAEQIRDIPVENEVLAIDQIGMADIVVLNKVDLVSEAELAQVRSWIAQIAPRSRIFPTTQSDVPLQLVLGIGLYDPTRLLERPAHDVHVHGDVDGEHDHHHHHDDHAQLFETWSYREERPFSLPALQKAVNDLPTSIYRAKGVLHLHEAPAVRCVLQVVGKRATITLEEPWGNEPPRTQFVVIGQAGVMDKASLKVPLEASLQENVGEQGGVLQPAVSWLRRSLGTK